VQNKSPVDQVFTVERAIDFRVDADGPVAEAGVRVQVSDIFPPSSLDFDDHIARSLTIPPGDYLNGPLGTEGANLQGSDSETCDLIVPAGGDTLYYRADCWAEGDAPSSSFFTSFSVEFTVTDVQAVPVPGAVLLGSIGLGFGGWKLRRRKEL
jgi:hypothetical protein